MKNGEEAVCAVLDSLNAAEIPYMLVGSFSSNAWGEPRSTKDADFVVRMNSTQRRSLLERLPEAFEVDQQISFETITGHTRQILRAPTIPFEIELFDLSEEPFDHSRFERRIQTTMLGREVWLPTAEDVIVQKLRWSKLGNRLKDLVDAQGVAKVRGDRLDWNYIEHWCGMLELGEILRKLKQMS